MRILSRRLVSLVAVLAVSAVVLGARSLPADKPEALGLSSERLLRINQMVQRYIDQQQVTGAITMVSRRGKVAHFEAQGLMDREAKTPMRKDAIFRIASMSKPITGVAILMLMEEGKLRLTDPVSRFIPEFKNPKVAMARTTGLPPAAPSGPPREPEIYTVPAEREITIRDLMTHTSGLESGGPGTRPGARLAPRNTASSLQAYIPTLGQVPLDFQPGTAVALQRARRHRNPRPHRRDRVGADIRSVPETAHLRPARDDRHRVLSHRRTPAARGDAL